MRATIFVTDDDDVVRASITRRLSRSSHEIRGFDSGESLLEALDHDIPDIILLDLKMTGMSGLETLKHIRPKAPETLVILLTAFGTVEDAVEAIKLGAYDFLIKSVDLSGVMPVIQRAVDYLTLRRRVSFESQDTANRFALDNLIAHSTSMKELVAQIQELASNTKTTVLLQGETGAGKEYIARILHHNGPRKNAPFVGVNCTAIPQELFESELFGYERGAFTGAAQRKPGLCEQAEGGTLFLDEIGDLNPTMQAKLLRVLQERSFKRLGGQEEIEVDFRLVAATNRDLRKEVKQGNFREDLFFRLNVVSLELPPLRNRVEDIFPLSQRFLCQHSTEIGKNITDIDQDARHLLEQYQYPGNIRELENIIERAVIFCHSSTLSIGDLPRELHEEPKKIISTSTQSEEQVLRLEMVLGKQTLAETEYAIIEEVMKLCGQNKSLAAQKLGLTRFALDRRLKKIIDESDD
ncbi:sigma-54 dependent transcriptional regulator [Candidatus Nitronereus thalassa]|uniref:Sigma-54 dependent transcriptional regulator n=1 Tax=Candidatus Nitronereus thalassa TaxID=3020898 RepID=A0ABU3K7J8_9BACT|nr:sigma-54 dependent transcriptional regulator [Candidatus Nitronereus thalassa]MDT7042350.1 sigma-54 dependent transcriptional regulator [Candidatus Nitronereus thalassa]